MTEQKRTLKPIERCPDGHFYNSSRTGEFCAVCGKKLDPPEAEEMTPEETEELTLQQEANKVCGWLVCIKGNNKGQDYVIREGKNFLGSASDMDIQVVGDKKIEKRNHAVIMYDPRQRSTMLLPPESRGMVYLNGQVLFEPTVLEPYDDLELGGSVFKYAPFCGHSFSWSETGSEDQREEEGA